MLHMELKTNIQKVSTYSRAINLNKVKTALKRILANPIVDNILGVTGTFIVFYLLFMIACNIY